MPIEALLRGIDSQIAGALNDALDGKDISVEQATPLLDSTGLEMNLVVAVADILRKRTSGNTVSFVLNRNINFTNVCVKRCGFCAFSRDFRNEEGYFLPMEEILRRATEAASLGATEVCIQAGLAPKMDGNYYIDICNAIKKDLPDMHIHAFSPEEVLYGASKSNMSSREYLVLLKEAGVGSLPGTAAEILDQPLRDAISPGRISAEEWIRIIKEAHSLGIPTTSTIMYGHIESSIHKARHMETIREIQKSTGGFTEFVPLSFVHSEAPMFLHGQLDGIRAGPTSDDIVKMHAVARIMLNNYIPNIQVSWVKEGTRMGQLLLSAGANDFGGTLMNESISTSAGSQNGQLLRPKEIASLIRSAGRIPVQRTTLYKHLREWDEGDTALDTFDSDRFGSYGKLVRLREYRYRDLASGRPAGN